MTIGHIQRNYIQQNSVGVGFYGYSGFSGWSGSGTSGFSGWSGQAGIAGFVAGEILWIDTRQVFNDVNGFYNYYNYTSTWDAGSIADGIVLRWPGVYWGEAGITGLTGFTRKMRAVAQVAHWGDASGSWWSMRITRLHSVMYEGGAYSVYSETVAGAASGYLQTSDVGDPKDYSPIIIATPWVSIPAEGYYFIEVAGNPTKKFIPHIIDIQFAEVKD